MSRKVIAGGFEKSITVNLSKVCQGNKLNKGEENSDFIVPRQFSHSVLAHSNIHSSGLSRRAELHVVLA